MEKASKDLGFDDDLLTRGMKILKSSKHLQTHLGLYPSIMRALAKKFEKPASEVRDNPLAKATYDGMMNYLNLGTDPFVVGFRKSGKFV